MQCKCLDLIDLNLCDDPADKSISIRKLSKLNKFPLLRCTHLISVVKKSLCLLSHDSWSSSSSNFKLIIYAEDKNFIHQKRFDHRSNLFSIPRLWPARVR